MADRPLRILFVSAEVAPFAKTGGLGDVSAALPRYLAARGHDVRLFCPFYRRVAKGGHAIEPVPGMEDLRLRIGPHDVRFSLKRARLPGSALDVHFVDCPGLYDREGIYTEDRDEHLRFLVLTYAALKCCQHMGFSPDIAHANDWQAALLPLVLETRFAWDRERFGGTRTVLTIHNLAHQGVFPAAVVPDTGLADSAHLFHNEQLSAGVVNFLLTGILYAGAITTVSPTYAREIQTDAEGGTLAPFLRARSASVVGILNGIDEGEWSPERDPLIPHRYSIGTLDEKVLNKKALMESMGLPFRAHHPVAGVVTRLTLQKGIELILEALPPLLARDLISLVVLGSGATSYENSLSHLQQRFPRNVCFYRGFSNPLAHLIEAGADVFLMPSRFEPCGLNQMYSSRYGTIPIVRATGGLADSVAPYDPNTARGTGFVFEHFTTTGMTWAIGEALRAWRYPGHWRQMQVNGMRADFSWERRVKSYEALYRRLLG